MTSEQDMLRLKARAFDDLMKVMDGRHYQVDHYRRPKPARLLPFGECPAEATMEVEDVYIYEWRIRVSNHTDLKKVCLNNAKKVLKRKKKMPLPSNSASEQAKATVEAINQLRQHIEFQAMLLHMRYTALRSSGFDHGAAIYLCQQDWSNLK